MFWSDALAFFRVKMKLHYNCSASCLIPPLPSPPLPSPPLSSPPLSSPLLPSPPLSSPPLSFPPLSSPLLSSPLLPSPALSSPPLPPCLSVQQPNAVSFCFYPFTLDAACKARLLEVESAIQMHVRMYVYTYNYREPLYRGQDRTQLAVLYREVSLIQR